MFVRRISGMILVLSLIAPMVVSYSLFSWRRAHVREEMRALIFKGLPREDLVHLTFSHDQLPGLLHWEKKDEFRYRGEMYDVVDSESRNDSIHYWCMHDHRESQLKRNFSSLLAGLLDHEPMTEKARQRLITFLKTDYTPGPFIRMPDLMETVRDWSGFWFMPAGIVKQEPFEPPPRIS